MDIEETRASVDEASPLVSVVMPVFNAGQFLVQAVESILGQTLTTFDFIIIDDGSTDGSREILGAFAAKDARIRLISRPNKGIGPTRNEGWKTTNAELIAIMDADDIAVPDRLEKQVAFLRAHPEVVCVSGLTRLIDAQGRWIPCPLTPPLEHEQILELLLKGACPVSNSAVMMRRTSIEQVGGYDEELSMAEDYALWLKLSEVGRLANLPDVLVSYRIHDGSVSERQTDLQLTRARTAWERAMKRRGIIGEFEQTANWRPKPTRESRHEFTLRCGWWAFNGGERQTALVLWA
jgi:glycosyltransferase involved in cell wall biosynthesis